MFYQGFTSQLMDTLTGLKVFWQGPSHLTFNHGFPIIWLSRPEEIA